MKLGKKKESLLGLILTAVLCLGFLYWWFRPQPQAWQDENAAQLVARALREPRPSHRVEQQVLDLDLLEIALGQVRAKLKDEALATAVHISDPLLRRLAAQQLARAYLNTDPQDFGEALDFTALVTDPAPLAALRTDILGLLAASGFADAALPEAKTPLQKAVLANRMSDADAKVRELLAAAEAALPSLPPDEAAALRRELARGRVKLSVTDGPAAAIAAIKLLPVEQRGELWTELTGWCQGRKDKAVTVPLVFAQVEDAALRRRLEIDSLLFDVKLRPPAEIIADCEAAANAAPDPEVKAAALLTLSDALRNLNDPVQEAAANEALKSAHTLAKTIADPAARCRILLRLARELSDAIVFDQSRAALDAAIAVTAAVAIPAERISLLIAAADECFKQADVPRAVQLIEQAADLLDPGAALDSAAIQALATAIIRRGDWPRALALVDRIPDESVRLAALDAVATTAAEDSTSVDPGNPPPRGSALDAIRREALHDQVRAANLTEAQPEGYDRARAWLALAKATLLPPSSLSDYMGAGAPPADEEPPAEDSPP